MPRYWLLKSDPEAFSIDDLARAKNHTTRWDGVRNYQARNFLRDEMAIGGQHLWTDLRSPYWEATLILLVGTSSSEKMPAQLQAQVSRRYRSTRHRYCTQSRESDNDRGRDCYRKPAAACRHLSK